MDAGCPKAEEMLARANLPRANLNVPTEPQQNYGDSKR